jgi:hypothetical protein
MLAETLPRGQTTAGKAIPDRAPPFARWRPRRTVVLARELRLTAERMRVCLIKPSPLCTFLEPREHVRATAPS